MVLLVSDMHFGRGPDERDRATEEALLACLEYHLDELDELVLLGDVFDHYIEYEHLVPKGAPRLKGRLAEWSENGLTVSYLVGNHDPWHRDYFTRSLGVEVTDGPIRRRLGTHRALLAHGDGLAPSNWIYNGLKPALRHPLLVGLYRSLLPADFGIRLARWWSRRHDRPEVRPEIAEDLRERARDGLEDPDTDLVVFAHSHRAEMHADGEGTYVNTGSWRRDRTYALVDGPAVQLLRWNGDEPFLVEQYGEPARSGDSS